MPCSTHGPDLLHGKGHSLLVVEIRPLGESVHEAFQIGARRLELASLKVGAQSVFDHLTLATLTSGGEHLGGGQDIGVQIYGGFASAHPSMIPLYRHVVKTASRDLLAMSLRGVEFRRGWALASLAPYLPAELLLRALDAARAISPGFGQHDVLTKLAPLLGRESAPSSRRRDVMRKEWHRTLRSVGRGGREELLFAMVALQPWSTELFDPETLADIASSIIELSACVW
jgi:hypothetical protein